MRNELLRFVCVGAIGFAIDASVLMYLAESFDMNLYAARCFSFGAASLSTWVLNRRLTFAAAKDRPKGLEYLRYMVIQSVGSSANLGVFTILLNASSGLARTPVVPLAIGAAAGLLINFAGSKSWVFR